jgi:hypothetical protein
MLKQTFEVYFKNIGYFSALAIVMTIVPICFEALAFAFPNYRIIFNTFLTLSILPLDAFCAFVAHRTVLKGETYSFFDFTKTASWPNKRFWFATFLFTLIIAPATYLSVVHQYYGTIQDLAFFVWMPWLDPYYFTIGTVVIYIILFANYALVFPAAALGQNISFTSASKLIRGHRSKMLIWLMAVMIVFYGIIALFTICAFYIFGLLHIPLFTFDDFGGFSITGVLPEYLFHLAFMLLTVGIVVALSNTYLDAKSDILGH